ncbi:MAG: lytic transglycosylase, partial [Pseudomonadota bacterium]
VSLLLPAFSSAADIDIKEQRRLFSRGERIAHKPQSAEYKQIVKQLANYPLLPYIEQKTLMRFPYLSNKNKIDTFLTHYANTPLDRPLRRKWLTYLAKNDQPTLFLKYYKDVNDPVLACYKVRMELEQPELKAQALDGIDKLWLKGKSQPKECDPAFKVWQNAGRRTPEMIWRRMALAANGGNHTLIPYLQKLLDRDQQYLGDLWLKVRRSPSFASRLSEFPGVSPQKEAEILAYGFGRLIWRDRDLALKGWNKANQRFTFDKEQEAYVTGRFALSLASADHAKAGEWLDKASQFEVNEELFRWHLTHLLRKQDWQKVLGVIDAAPVEVSSDLTYQYWQGRSYENMDAKPQAERIFEQLADNRHYYGFLASGKIKREIHLMNHPLAYTPEQVASVENMPAAARAKEFLALKRYASARREWVHFQARIDDQQKLISAVIANNWGWHDRAIFTLSRVGYLDDVKLRFPLAYNKESGH